MNPIYQWAERHNISNDALLELHAILSTSENTKQETGLSEAAVTSRVKLSASKVGMKLFRNNVGACETADGRQIRYGLANDSKRMNSQHKSGDLIGFTPVTIQPYHVGRILAVFTSIEVKKANWRYTGKGREVAQKRWIDFVNSAGGIAGFVNHENQLDEICTNAR